MNKLKDGKEYNKLRNSMISSLNAHQKSLQSGLDIKKIKVEILNDVNKIYLSTELALKSKEKKIYETLILELEKSDGFNENLINNQLSKALAYLCKKKEDI